MPYYNGIINRSKTPAASSGVAADRPLPTYDDQLWFQRSVPRNIQQVVNGSWITLADEGAGVVGNLQQVTDNGSVTTNPITASSLIKAGGTSSQFLKADGSVDNNTYITSVGTLQQVTAVGSSTNILVGLNGGSTGQGLFQWTTNGNVFQLYQGASGSAVERLRVDESTNHLMAYDIFFDGLSGGSFSGASTVNITNAGVATMNSFVKIGGTSAQFLKADGSVDNNTYITSVGSLQQVTAVGASTNIEVALNGGSTGQQLFQWFTSGNVIQLYQGSPGSAVERLRVDQATNHLMVYDVYFYGITGGNFSGASTVNITNAGVATMNSFVKIGGTSAQFLKADGSVDNNTYITSVGTLQSVCNNGSVTTTSITANAFIKTGGTSTQFLKADGSIDPNTYITGSGTLNSIPLFTGSTAIGNANMTQTASGGRILVNSPTDDGLSQLQINGGAFANRNFSSLNASSWGMFGQLNYTAVGTETAQYANAGVLGSLGFNNATAFIPYVTSKSAAISATTYKQNTGDFTGVMSGVFSCGEFQNTGNVMTFASLRAFRPEQQTGGVSFTGTLTNSVGVFIDDTSLSSIVSKITNKYGIYQAGASDVNYFAGVINAITGVKFGAGAAVMAYYDRASFSPNGNIGGITARVGNYERLGNCVTVNGSMTYPVTSDTQPAVISNMPYSASIGGLLQVVGKTGIYAFATSGVDYYIFDVSTGLPVLNSAMSGLSIKFSGFYYI